ncbi:hypothetical protein GCM10009776_28050 [Microbacterium deminutum]|uniref:Uncharacterized protein n=1 Tax=Microbacterium deminutum TaxID=344164 RepID=A0ABP5CIT7_9MICO
MAPGTLEKLINDGEVEYTFLWLDDVPRHRRQNGVDMAAVERVERGTDRVGGARAGVVQLRSPDEEGFPVYDELRGLIVSPEQPAR